MQGALQMFGKPALTRGEAIRAVVRSAVSWSESISKWRVWGEKKGGRVHSQKDELIGLVAASF